LGATLNFLIFPFGLKQNQPSDKIAHKIAEFLLKPSETSNRICQEFFLFDDGKNHLADLKKALKLAISSEELEKRIRKAEKKNIISGTDESELVNDALTKNIITKKESEILLELAQLRKNIVAVDDFATL
jgi:hypothetical protein